VFILLRGELVMLDLDQTTILFRISPGTVFGEGTVIRQLEVGRKYWEGSGVGEREGGDRAREEQGRRGGVGRGSSTWWGEDHSGGPSVDIACVWLA
jgi:hypothetical protein